MARPINYLFCRYNIEKNGEYLDEGAQFNLLSENQGLEQDSGNLKEGYAPLALCTQPERVINKMTAHSFEIGFKKGFRYQVEYDESRKTKTHKVFTDSHTKFGHVVTIPSIGAMALRHRSNDDSIDGLKTITTLKYFIRGILDGEGQMNVTHASEEDFEKAFEKWSVYEYSFTARPLNPTGGDLAKMRSKMYEDENVYKEVGRVNAPPGESLSIGEGTLGQTFELFQDGYAQLGFRATTEEGHNASIPKQAFHQEKEKNLRVRETRPHFIRIAFDRESDYDEVTEDVISALASFYS
jgi:hypothetical protein